MSTSKQTSAALHTTTSVATEGGPNDDDVANKIKQRKQALRRDIRSKLKTMTQEEIENQSSMVWEKLFRLPEFEQAKSVGLFLSMPQGEIMTREACKRVLLDGKTLYIPRVGLDFEKSVMDLTAVNYNNELDETSSSKEKSNVMFYDSWPRNKWGIPEAPLDNNHPIAEAGDIDLLVVPGLGFDRYGGRLGQGKGYYDRFIANMKTSENAGIFMNQKRPILVAVGLEASFVDDNDGGEEPCIPMLPHDYRMDKLILPHLETLNISKNS